MQNRFIQKKPMAFADLTSDWHGKMKTGKSVDIINMKLGGVDRMHYWQMNYYVRQLIIQKILKHGAWDFPYWIHG